MGFAPVGSLFLGLRRIAQWHHNVQFEMNKTYAESEGKEIFQVGSFKLEVERRKWTVERRKELGSANKLKIYKYPVGGIQL